MLNSPLETFFLLNPLPPRRVVASLVTTITFLLGGFKHAAN